MPGEPWFYAAIGVVTGAHLLALAYVALARDGTPWSRPADRDGDGSGPDTCACPDCGAENDPEYRFCRRCVGELPRASSESAGPGGAATRPDT